MLTNSLSTEVRTFIDENISSYEDLQVLLLMHDHPGRKWDASDIAEQLRIEPFSASQHLMKLCKKGLVAHKDSSGALYDFEYTPYPEAKEQHISALAMAFERARADVVDYIFKKSRTQFQSFADAFNFKKD